MMTPSSQTHSEGQGYYTVLHPCDDGIAARENIFSEYKALPQKYYAITMRHCITTHIESLPDFLIIHVLACWQNLLSARFVYQLALSLEYRVWPNCNPANDVQLDAANEGGGVRN